MPTYKLYYFDVPARGELPRIILSAAGQPFEDIRFSGQEWPKYKPKMPFGQVPVLEVDGQMIAQEYAISKFLARQFGFCSEDNLDHAREDMYVFLSEDIYVKVEEIFHTRDDKEKSEALKKKFVNETGPVMLSKLEQALSKSASGYLVRGKLSWADLAVFSNLGVMEFILPTESVNLLEHCPNIRRNMELVRRNPNVNTYLKQRPSPNA
ncbi:glutathione S-transferase-like [Liolophura sinensis]|uniref:glutathione S-transferase-like n=1 Tax=Liolophura sinensis TaxID=3198878 RepID=UPI003158055C